MTYARARLLLGISGVGTWVLACVAALAFALPYRLLPASPSGWLSEIGALVLVVVLYAGLSLPFDLAGGYLLPRRHHRTSQSFSGYIVVWLRGALVQGTILVAMATVLLWAGRSGGLLAALGIALCGSMLLLAFQEFVGRAVARLTPRRLDLRDVEARLQDHHLVLPRLVALSGEDQGFTGGIVGLPGRETVIIPAEWRSRLTSSGLTMQIMRRIYVLRTGGRMRGVAIAVGWNLLGFLVALQLPGAGVDTVAGLVSLACGSTLWSFIGLLLLPSVNRAAVFAADNVPTLVDRPESFIETLRVIDRSQDDEPVRERWIERIFHPIPALRARIERLERSTTRDPGAWNVARLSLFLSWSTLGFLSRAVHCNSGRPELWVLFPCD